MHACPLVKIHNTLYTNKQILILTGVHVPVYIQSNIIAISSWDSAYLWKTS